MTARPAAPVAAIRLTEMTDCGGCAAKLGADLLADALSGLGAIAPASSADGALIAGLEPPDDAAAYRISDDLAILGTLDFFPPLVDDPAAYGEIAAANALSDVFAMGGRVLFALSIAAFPEDFPRDAMAAVFEAAAGKVREAGGVLAGGHTIRDPEPKYGLAVIGAAHPDRLFRKGGARPGDVLLLTKRLGTGFLVSGRRSGRTSDADLEAAIDQMRTLNRAASEVLARHGIAGRDRRDRASGCWGTAWRWRGHRAHGWCSTPPRCPRSTVRSTSRGPASRPAAPATTAASRRPRSRWRPASPPSSSPSPTTRRRRGACSPRCTRTSSTPSRPTSRRPVSARGSSGGSRQASLA